MSQETDQKMLEDRAQKASEYMTRARELFELVTKTHADVYEFFVKAKKDLSVFELEQYADVVSYVNDIMKLADDVRKECGFTVTAFSNAACLQWATLGVGDPIRGERCTATPSIKQVVLIPTRSRDPKGFAEVLKFLGVPDEVVEHGILNLHWPTLTDHLSNLVAEGKPLPKCLDGRPTYNTYSLTIRKKRS